jgi:lipoyl(octanoyl) transferase
MVVPRLSAIMVKDGLTLRNNLTGQMAASAGSPPVEWVMSAGLTDYADAVTAMETHVDAIAAGLARERVWLVEHPPLYTAGTSAQASDMLEARFPVHQTGRGGQYTYHGPGQRVAYVMLDLNRRTKDVRRFVATLEAWIIATLATFNIHGETCENRVGVWVQRPDKPRGLNDDMAEDKIAAIGIRMRKWVTYHGISLNVEPELAHFSAIVPCGISERHLGVTSLVDLGLPVDMADADAALKLAFGPAFGPLQSGS